MAKIIKPQDIPFIDLDPPSYDDGPYCPECGSWEVLGQGDKYAGSFSCVACGHKWSYDRCEEYAAMQAERERGYYDS